MAYSQTTVLLGGLVHIPIIIGLLWFFDNTTAKGYRAQQAAKEAAEAKAALEAKVKAEAEAKAAAEKAAKAKAKAAADKAASAKAKDKDGSGNNKK